MGQEMMLIGTYGKDKVLTTQDEIKKNLEDRNLENLEDVEPTPTKNGETKSLLQHNETMATLIAENDTDTLEAALHKQKREDPFADERLPFISGELKDDIAMHGVWLTILEGREHL